MARKRKPCEWCEGEQFIRLGTDETRNVRADLEIYPDNCIMAFYVQGLSDDGELTAEESVDIPMNYCPACGRKLGY